MKEVFRGQGDPNIHEPTNLGFSSPQHERSPHGEGSKSPEHQPLPNVWEILERDVRFGERYDKDEVDLTVPFETLFANQEYKEGERELSEVKGLANEIHKKGTVYDKLILDLYNTVTLEPSGFPVLNTLQYPPITRGMPTVPFEI